LEIGLGPMDELDLQGGIGLRRSLLHRPTEQCAEEPQIAISISRRKESQRNLDFTDRQITHSLIDDKVTVVFQPSKLFPVVVGFVRPLELQVIVSKKLVECNRFCSLLQDLDLLEDNPLRLPKGAGLDWNDWKALSSSVQQSDASMILPASSSLADEPTCC
jgi:hypothetical protein